MSHRILISGASIAGPALAFWMRRLGWQVVLLERAPAFRDGGQNIDVRGPGRDALERMGLLDVVKAGNTTEQAWTFVDADNATVARFGKDDFGGDGPTAELEILRGDLARILDRASGDIERRFGDHITSLQDDGDAVTVGFDKAAPERFDLVVAAEGVGSSTRSLLFGDAARIEPWGLDTAYFTIPKGVGDGEDARWFNAPGGRSLFLRPDPQGTTRVVMSVQQDPKGWDDLSSADQKQVLTEHFSDAGWETARILEGLKHTDDFYFHSIAQLKLEHFSKGRVALTGDAAWAVMGRGTTLALIGPYVLAGELARRNDVVAALKTYDQIMRPFADIAQDVPRWGPKALQPQTRFGIGFQHAILKLITAPGVRLVTERFSGPGDDLPSLPDYPELSAASPAGKP
ncbi:FAD-dependent monooxygenase [Brevundimonas sp.]|jgi:2-polyprenyl-6-methoxyphenol hydroxylase-like FAD-dependent oxidoreductase|uniref:FAD-dependent monooxygenase n=1 Tax=Brevundimonas sp. TaxID=1871086 RepID=UPI0037C0F764